MSLSSSKASAVRILYSITVNAFFLLPDAIANVLENHLKRGQTELKLEFPKVEAPKVVTQQPVYQTVTSQPQESSGMQ
jgi:hypothetical protein